MRTCLRSLLCRLVDDLLYGKRPQNPYLFFEGGFVCVLKKKTDFVFKMVPFLEPKLGPPGSVLGFLFCWKTWCRAQFWPSMEGTQNGSKNGTDPQFGTAPKTEQKLNRKLFFGLFFEAALWHLLFLLQNLSATHETAKPTSSLTPSSIYWNLPCALANVLNCVASHFFQPPT